MSLEVLLCDNHLLAVVKPACVPTVPDESGDESLLERARAWVKTTYEKPGEAFLGVVQRLDRPVSGVVLFARTSKAARRLTSAFAERRVAKQYWGLVREPPPCAPGRVEQWLAKDRRTNRVQVVPEAAPRARRAVTEWRVLERGPDSTLVELVPHSGRPHQLRVAMASLGSPLLGDLKYGARDALPDRSIALHARALSLTHPVRDEELRIEVPPPSGAPWTAALCEAARREGPRVVRGGSARSS